VSVLKELIIHWIIKLPTTTLTNITAALAIKLIIFVKIVDPGSANPSTLILLKGSCMINVVSVDVISEGLQVICVSRLDTSALRALRVFPPTLKRGIEVAVVVEFSRDSS